MILSVRLLSMLLGDIIWRSGLYWLQGNILALHEWLSCGAFLLLVFFEGFREVLTSD